MLTNCPECNLQISDKAITCPHCGYPMKTNTAVLRKPRRNRRKRLPNGFGQISEIKGKGLRKPFRAMVTVGKDENGRPICKLLKPVSYFETYNDAYAALMDYNRNPYDLRKTFTVGQLYEKWSEEHYSRIAKSSSGNFKFAWNYGKRLENIPVRDLHTYQIKECMKEGYTDRNRKYHNPTVNSRMWVKVLFSMMLDYAIENEYINQNVAKNIKIVRDEELVKNTGATKHFIYSAREMDTLWKHVSEENVDMILIQCYSGWRPSELCELKVCDIDLEKGVFKGGLKTKAGKDRLVPIHSKIQKLVENRYQNSTMAGSDYLFLDSDGNHIGYRKYRESLISICEKYNLDQNHTPHDCRKHFISMAKKNVLDEYAIKYIVGHSIQDLTERVYTERELTWLRAEMEKIK